MENFFENILDKDEKIIKIYKPNKTKLFASVFFGTFFFTLFFAIISIIGILVPDETGNTTSLYFLLIPIGLLITAILLALGFAAIYYNNLFFAYSNKRIIIRTGIFGVDYKSLDLNMIGAIDVNISLLDKLVKHNTGSIIFGSPASPMMNTNNSNAFSYAFRHIEMPYDVYREIKDVIDKKKKETK